MQEVTESNEWFQIKCERSKILTSVACKFAALEKESEYQRLVIEMEDMEKSFGDVGRFTRHGLDMVETLRPRFLILRTWLDFRPHYSESSSDVEIKTKLLNMTSLSILSHCQDLLRNPSSYFTG